MSDEAATLTKVETPTEVLTKVEPAPIAPVVAAPAPVEVAPVAPAAISLLSPETPKVEIPVPFDAEKLTFPEGFDKTEANAAYGSFVGLAGEIGLSHEQAQKLVDYHVAETTKATTAMQANWTRTQDAWIAEVKADKEIGNIDVLRQTVAKVVGNAKFTDPKFEEAMALTGAGNHPAVLRTLFRWAQALGEGTPVAGTPPVRGANGQLLQQQPTPAQSIYGPNGPATGGPRLART